MAGAFIIAVLYFALMELLLLDSARALQEAQRYRSRVIADALAESGAELAAVQLVDNMGGDVKATDPQGSMSGVLTRSGNQFVLVGDGIASGVPGGKAHVQLQGTIIGKTVSIVYSTHTP
jgi:hypothetical protein